MQANPAEWHSLPTALWMAKRIRLFAKKSPRINPGTGVADVDERSGANGSFAGSRGTDPQRIPSALERRGVFNRIGDRFPGWQLHRRPNPLQQV